jgi:hypothetical protein
MQFNSVYVMVYLLMSCHNSTGLNLWQAKKKGHDTESLDLGPGGKSNNTRGSRHKPKISSRKPNKSLKAKKKVIEKPNQGLNRQKPKKVDKKAKKYEKSL